MAEGLSFERVTARVTEGVVEFSFPDGTTTSAPPHIVSKSALLRDALETDSAEHSVCIHVCLPVPEGFLSSWLQLQLHMDALSDLEQANSNEQANEQANSNEILRHADAGLLSKYLKVADFFGDKDTLMKVCKHTGSWLFERPCADAHNHSKRSRAAFETEHAGPSRAEVLVLSRDIYSREEDNRANAAEHETG